jgi:hypothetical protein
VPNITPAALRKLRLPGDLLAIGGIPLPADVDTTSWTPRQSDLVASWARDQLRFLVEHFDDLDLDIAAADRDTTSVEDYADAVRAAGTWLCDRSDVLQVADRSVSTPFELDELSIVTGCMADANERVRARATAGDMAGLKLAQAWFDAAVTVGMLSRLTLAATEIARVELTPFVQSETTYQLVSATFRCLGMLHEKETQVHGRLADFHAPAIADLAGVVTVALTAQMGDLFDQLDGGVDGSWKPGVFSALRLPELTRLAIRDPVLVRRYGDKQVEKRFEHQLALLFQSLGFVVIQTRTGTRTVDLVCISTDPTERITFLVEAKTTKAPYALPAKDERALRDYVADINATLTSLPPLKFVLLVSHAGTATLDGKLRDFEIKAGTPIRFLKASALSALREEIPGPAPTTALLQLIVGAQRILPDDLAQRVGDAYRSTHEAHRAFAEALMAAARPVL